MREADTERETEIYEKEERSERGREREIGKRGRKLREKE